MNMKFWIAALPIASISAFTFSTHPFKSLSRSGRALSLQVAIDPTLITAKELQEISGDNTEDLDRKLRQNVYAYPKHVEVIKDFENVVDEMVNDIVSVT